jgi:hypothetical protein
VDLLLEIGLLARAKVSQPDKSEKEQLLPTHPAAKIQISEVAALTDSPIKNWLENWEPATSKSLKQFARNLDKNGTSLFGDNTLESLI